MNFFANPLEFVGRPDWRSAVLAAIFVAPWLILLAGKWLRRWQTWVVLVAGIVLFPLTIAWIQVPIQQALSALYLNTLPIETIGRFALLLSIPLVLVSGLVQEAVKFGIGVAGLHLADERRDSRAGLAMGAAAGAGYGGIEAFWVFNMIFGAGFSLATVQLAGPLALAGFVERFFTVMFHISLAAISTYGYATGRPWPFLLLAIVVHSLANYIAVLAQAGLVGIVATEVILALIALTTLAWALWLRARSRPELPAETEFDEGAEPSAEGEPNEGEAGVSAASADRDEADDSVEPPVITPEH